MVLDEIRRQFPAWSARLGDDHQIDLKELGRISETALTRDAEIESGQSTVVSGPDVLLRLRAELD